MFDYQPDRHCSKTLQLHARRLRRFDYQSDRHCSKTYSAWVETGTVFDYQSDRHCSKTDWESMPQAERDAYIKRHGNKEGEAYEAYVRSRVVDEIETRDPKWYKMGKPSPVTKERGAKPLKKERKVSARLSEQGFCIEFMKEINRTGVKTADAKLNGVVWEFKVPESYNERTVKNQFFKARDKGTSRLLISCTENHAAAEDVVGDVMRIYESGDYSYIDEVLVMDESGGITRLKR